MSYNFSISGHANDEATEWALIQALAAAAQQYGASGAHGSTQFHGLVDLLRVQAGVADTGTEAGVNEASSVLPQPLTNLAGEVIGFGSQADPTLAAAAALLVPPVVPETAVVTAATVGAITNDAGEVIGHTDTPAQTEPVAVDPTPAVPAPGEPTIPSEGLLPVYGANGELVGYVQR